MRLMNEDFPTFGIPTIIRRIGAPTMPAFARFSISGFSSWLRTIGTNCLMPFPVLQRQGKQVLLLVVLHPTSCGIRVCHICLIQEQHARFLLYQTLHFRILAAAGDSGVQNFYHSIHQRQIRRNHPACFCHMSGKPLNRSHLNFRHTASCSQS